MTASLIPLRAAMPLLLAGLAMAALSSGAQARQEARRSLDFRVVIPAVLRVALIETPRTLVVPAQAGGSRNGLAETATVQVQNNCRTGVNLAADVVDPDVERVHLEFEGEPFAVGTGGASLSIPFWGTAPRRFRIQYRVDVKPGAQAGARPWPVTLRFTNCA